MAEQHDSWCKRVLGIDPVEILQAAGHAIAEGASAVVSGAESLVGGTSPPAQSAPDPQEAAFQTQMTAIDAQIAHLRKDGLDASHMEAKAKQLRADHDRIAAGTDAPTKQKAMQALVAEATQEATRTTADTARGDTSAVEGIDKAIKDMRATAGKLIDKLDPKNKDKPDLAKRLATLDTDIDTEQKEADRAKRNQLLKKMQRTAELLLDDSAAAAKDPAAAQGAYKQALLDRYGFQISEKAGVSTHNDSIYRMFDKAPDTDVTQDKLTVLKYDNKMPDGSSNPSAFYWGGNGTTQKPEIVMGQYGGTETLPYQDPTSKQPEAPNAFDISTLHELGHSVDDRYQLMKKYGGNDGAGGWQTETVQTVAGIYVTRFSGGAGGASPVRPAILSASVLATLQAGTVTLAGGATPDEGKAMAALLASCAKRGVASNPWNAEDDIGGRSYHDSGGTWVSYATKARAMALNVSKYQWRSPAEFFAELYAWTYYNSKAPPGPVETGLKPYLYGGNAAPASPPATH